MKITKCICGWHFGQDSNTRQVPTALIIVDFELVGHPATYSAFVVLDRETGAPRSTYFRNAGTATIGPLGEVSGEGLEFPLETRLEVEDVALKFAIEKKLCCDFSS